MSTPEAGDFQPVVLGTSAEGTAPREADWVAVPPVPAGSEAARYGPMIRLRFTTTRFDPRVWILPYAPATDGDVPPTDAPKPPPELGGGDEQAQGGAGEGEGTS